jgi:hypothetical protein
MKALFVLMFVSSAAMASDAALLSCRQLADGPGRLACYNAIPVGVPLASATTAAAPGAVAAAAAAPAAAPSAAAPAPNMVTVAPGVVMAAPNKTDLEQMFGREPAVLKSMQLDKIESTIPGYFDGWVAGQRIRLANGSVWKVVDGSDDIMELRDPKVTVKRGLLGAIFLDIEGAHRNPKVQRVQ